MKTESPYTYEQILKTRQARAIEAAKFKALILSKSDVDQIQVDAEEQKQLVSLRD